MRIFCLVLAGLIVNYSTLYAAPQRIHTHQEDIFHTYCGIQVLKESFRAFNVSEHQAFPIFKSLKQIADHHYGYNTFTELKKAAEDAGLRVSAVKTGIEGIKELVAHGQVVVNTTGNRHFCLLKKVLDQTVTVYIPGVKQDIVEMRWEEFTRFWDGSVLMINRSGFKGIKNRIAFKGLSPAELDQVRGGDNCDNTSGSSSVYGGANGSGTISNSNGSKSGTPSTSNKSTADTSDPVNIADGNMFMVHKDISFPARGQAVNLTRFYNTEVVSEVPGWTPDPGAGTWVIENGEYSGQGDRVTSNASYDNLTLELDLQTITPGASYPWQVAWVHFRYAPQTVDPRKTLNSYYLDIKTDGNIELSKWQNGTQYFLTSRQTSLSPTNKNHIKIDANGGVIKIYLNGTLLINYTDTNPILAAGKVALESYFCHAHFDNVSIKTGVTTNLYAFDSDDNDFIFGYGWTHSYALRVKEYTDHVTLFRENNSKELYALQSNGTYKSFPVNTYDIFTKDATGYTLRTKKRLIYRFGTNGRLQYIQDLNGNKISLADGIVNGKSVLTNIQDPSGRSIILTYGANGMVSQAADPAGKTVQYAYDANNNLIRVTDRIGRITQFTYDPITRNMVSMKDPAGNTYQYSYVYNDRISIQTDPLGQQTKFDYFWDTINITNKNGNTYKYNFNSSAFLSSVADPLNQIEMYANDNDGNVLRYTDKNGRNTSWTYDANGNPVTSTDAAGTVSSRTYDNVLNLPTSITDAVGNTTTLQYDGRGNLIQITYPGRN